MVPMRDLRPPLGDPPSETPDLRHVALPLSATALKLRKPLSNY